MPKAIYISEMAISDMHGGGLTLQRVLAEDLESFERFIHLSSFAKQFPIVPRLKGKEWNIFEDHLPLHRPPRWRLFSYAGYLWRRYSLGRSVNCSYGAREISAEIIRSKVLSDANVLFVPQAEATIYVANTLFRHQQFPYSTWMMDDHPLLYTRKTGFHYREAFELEMAFHLQHAKKVFVISHPMQSFYKSRFGIDSRVLFGPANPIGPIDDQPKEAGKVRLCYFGAIWDWQEDALKKLIPHLLDLNAELTVYSFHVLPTSMRCTQVIQENPIPGSQVLETMRKYDAVVVPLGFSDDNRCMSELNYSTKMAECLAAGTPIVAIGPSYGAMVRFLSDRNAALIIDDPCDPKQWGALRTLKNPDVRKQLLDNAIRVSQNETSSAAMHTIWNSFWE